MPLQTLRPMQIAQPQPMNAFLAGQAGAQRAEKQNWLRAQEGRAAETFEMGKEDREATKATQKIEKESKAISTALKAPTLSQQQQIYKALGGTGNIEVLRGGEIKFTYPDGETIVGQQKDVLEFATGVYSNPKAFTDPTMQQHIMAWAASKGLQINLAGDKKAITGKGTEGERTWMRETGGKIPYSVWERKQKIKDLEAKKAAGYTSPEDRIEYQGYATEYRAIKRKIRDEKVSPVLLFKGDSSMKTKKLQQIKDLEDEAKDFKKLMDLLIPPKEVVETSLDIPQETIDYWIEKGKSLEEIREAYEKKYGDKAPSIGY